MSNIANIGCPLERVNYDYRNAVCVMQVPADACVDATAALQLARKLFPGVTELRTFAGDQLDTMYRFAHGHWIAFEPTNA